VSLDRGQTLSTFQVDVSGLQAGDRIGAGLRLPDGGEARFKAGTGRATVWSPLDGAGNGMAHVAAAIIDPAAETAVMQEHVLVTVPARGTVRFLAGGGWSKGRDEMTTTHWMREGERRTKSERMPIRVTNVSTPTEPGVGRE